jgi:hypothetical protein
MLNETYDRLIEEAGDDIVKKLRFVADYIDAQEDAGGTTFKQKLSRVEPIEDRDFLTVKYSQYLI